MAAKRRDIIGNVYGRLTVLRDSELRTKRGAILWECRCVCGTIKNIEGSPLIGGRTVSCGCYGIEARRKALMESTRKLTPEQKEEVCQLYISGASSAKIAKQFGVNSSSIRDILASRKINRRDAQHCGRIHSLNEEAFSEVTAESAYWVGFLMADGNIFCRAISLVLHDRDLAHIEKFRAFLGASHTIVPIKKNGIVFAHRLEVRSGKIVNDLARFGVVPNKSRTANIIGLEDNEHFWRGIIDGDGWIGLSYAVPRIQLVGSSDIIAKFIDFVRGICPDTKAKVNHHKSIFSTSLAGPRAVSIIRALYADAETYLDRKQKKAIDIINGGRGIFLRSLVDHPEILQ